MSIQTKDYKQEVVAQLEFSLVDLVAQQDGNLSFAQMEKLDHFKGEVEMIDKRTNCVFWQGVSVEAICAIVGLVRKEIIVVNETSLLPYYTAKRVLPLPLARLECVFLMKLGIRKGYKRPHWVPAVIDKGPNFTMGIVQ